MMVWLRRVTPDVLLAAVVALLITMVLNKLDRVEHEHIISEVRSVAHDGLTIDERIAVFEQSIRRSLLVYQPLLVAIAAITVGFLCRLRKWAWLTAVLAIIPALVIGAGFLIDTPLVGSGLVASYIALASLFATASVSVRNRFLPAIPHRSIKT